MARPKGTFKTPTYRLHRASGQAIVTIDGRDQYLGAYESDESRQKYNRLVAEWLLRGGQGPSAKGQSATIAQLLVGFLPHAKGYYAKGTMCHYINVAKWLRLHYGETPAHEFGPQELRALREKMIVTQRGCGGYKSGGTLSRTYINAQIKCMIQVFRWGAENGFYPAHAYHELQVVRPLQFNRSHARETARVLPAEDKDVNAVVAIAPGTLAAMIRLQLLTGARSGELCIMRGCDIDVSKEVWKYIPSHHKNTHRGRSRAIFFGPKAQALIRPYMKTNVQAYIFSPREAWAESYKLQRDNRRCKRLNASQRRAKFIPPAAAGDHYTSASYANAIRRLCRRANAIAHRSNPSIPRDQIIVKDWHAHQLRHNAATFLRQQFGIEVARQALGHKDSGVTEIYAEADQQVVANIMAKAG